MESCTRCVAQSPPSLPRLNDEIWNGGLHYGLEHTLCSMMFVERIWLCEPDPIETSPMHLEVWLIRRRLLDQHALRCKIIVMGMEHGVWRPWLQHMQNTQGRMSFAKLSTLHSCISTRCGAYAVVIWSTQWKGTTWKNSMKVSWNS